VPLEGLLDHASRHLGLLRVDDAQRHGLSRFQLDRLADRGVLELLGENVYRVCGAPGSWDQTMLATCWRVGAGAVASHRSAAALYGLSRSRRGLIEVSVPRGEGARPAGRRVHETRHRRGADLGAVGPIPVTSPERTVIDMAGIGPADRTEQMLDDAVHKGLTTSRRVADHLGSMPTRGRRGSRQLWALLSERTGDPDERANAWENLMARLLRGSDLPVPVRQQKVEVDGHVHYLDFAFPAQMVAVECDSLEWHSTSQQLLHDLDRQHRCESAGWAFKRFVKSQALADPAGTVAKVRSLMVERGWSPANY
jgi:very-short-patch-repair endonuclease